MAFLSEHEECPLRSWLSRVIEEYREEQKEKRRRRRKRKGYVSSSRWKSWILLWQPGRKEDARARERKKEGKDEKNEARRKTSEKKRGKSGKEEQGDTSWHREGRKKR